MHIEHFVRRRGFGPQPDAHSQVKSFAGSKIGETVGGNDEDAMSLTLTPKVEQSCNCAKADSNVRAHHELS